MFLTDRHGNAFLFVFYNPRQESSRFGQSPLTLYVTVSHTRQGKCHYEEHALHDATEHSTLLRQFLMLGMSSIELWNWRQQDRQSELTTP